MGLESDIPDFWGWFYIEQILLFIFMFELLVRLRRQGRSFFIDKHDWVWNSLDFIIVAGAILDAYLLPLIGFCMELLGRQKSSSGNLGQIMMMLRMARLLRMLRLIRLIKSIPPLYVLVQGIAKAMQGMAWVVVLTVLLLYICALLAVKLIGHGLLFPGGKAPEDIQGLFPCIALAIP
jgi:voltage-gated sodium channel